MPGCLSVRKYLVTLALSAVSKRRIAQDQSFEGLCNIKYVVLSFHRNVSVVAGAIMFLGSKKTSLAILALTSLTFARLFFLLINDPEGPNLIVVTGLGVIIFAASLALYIFFPPARKHELRKLLPTLLFQMMLVAGFYVWLK
jgi:hypothetical protein